MDALGDVVHPKFSYVYVSSDINTPVKVLEFEGRENDFKDLLTSHFTRHSLLPEERQDFEKYLVKQYEESKPKAPEGDGGSSSFKLTPDFMSNTIDTAGSNYQVRAPHAQIIPLTLPSKKTDFLGVNCYIDGIGRVKNLPTNARMTRMCSTGRRRSRADIRGDCFISRTYDDEDVFKRVDFTLDDYNELMANPPSAEGRWVRSTLRWDASTALSNALTQQAAPKPEVRNACENCKKVGALTAQEAAAAALRLCSGCRKVKYCSVQCQREDWRFHRRICRVSH